ncbi:MAG: glycine cleavage system protein GcvH [Spirochaetales bacterium]|nr:glycine cleavage system protein GcvH [Spirochaetales bacterium]
MSIDKNSRYRASHEWARKDGARFVAGISDHAQEALGDIVFIELPAIGKTFKQGEAFGVIESVKAASDVYLPMSGTIVAVNDALAGDPAIVNKEPYTGGWLVAFEATEPSEWDSLLTPEAYEAESGKE